MQATSRASSKLLHGGLRYLENGEFRLVRESLRERDAWLHRVPALARPLSLVLPIYSNSSRGRWKIGAGLFLYDHIAGKSFLPGATWLSPDKIKQRDPQLKSAGLIGGYEFSDGQMDDYSLGLWVADRAKEAGVRISEDQPVACVTVDGALGFPNGTKHYFDRVINVAGPWASSLLEQSGVPSSYRLDLIRGSHLVLNKPCEQPYLLEVPGERRIFFVLPWQGKTLVGTTEVRQTLDEDIECSAAERSYLLNAYNYYRTEMQPDQNTIVSFAGIRPLLYSAADPSKATREYAIHKTGKLTTILGGKWTTALALAQKVTQLIH